MKMGVGEKNGSCQRNDERRNRDRLILDASLTSRAEIRTLSRVAADLALCPATFAPLVHSYQLELVNSVST